MHAFTFTILVLAVVDILHRAYLLSIGDHTTRIVTRREEALSLVFTLIFAMWALVLLAR